MLCQNKNYIFTSSFDFQKFGFSIWFSQLFKIYWKLYNRTALSITVKFWKRRTDFTEVKGNNSKWISISLAAITGMTNQQFIDFLRGATWSDLMTHCEISRDESLPLSPLPLARNNVSCETHIGRNLHYIRWCLSPSIWKHWDKVCFTARILFL